jgi:hypothetical protein
MPFGKYKGIPLENLPDDYIVWLKALTNLRPPLRKAVRDEWQSRLREQQEREEQARRAPAPAPLDPEDRALMGELVRAGFRVLASKYHPDHGGVTRSYL